MSEIKAKKITAIHQFHSVSAYGDAITNGLLFTRGLLQELGFESIIYVEHVAPELTHELQHYSTFSSDPDHLLLLHHSIGHDLDGWVEKINNSIYLVYHNITPPHFFPKRSIHYRKTKQGLAQLESFKSKIDATIADSAFNASDLHKAGYDAVTVLPMLFDVESLRNHPWNEALVQEQSQVPTILFVGRVCPNKGQLHLIKIAKLLKELVDHPFQLVLVGGFAPTDPYTVKVQEAITANHLDDCVRLTGKIPAEDLYAWYRSADVYVCMSEHEGFGVPLIEAMAFDVPVIALNNSNVGDTLGSGGILIRHNNPGAIALLIKLLINNLPLRSQVIQEQRKRIQSFTHSKILEQLVHFLQEQDIEIPNRPVIAAEKA